MSWGVGYRSRGKIDISLPLCIIVSQCTNTFSHVGYWMSHEMIITWNSNVNIWSSVQAARHTVENQALILGVDIVHTTNVLLWLQLMSYWDTLKWHRAVIKWWRRTVTQNWVTGLSPMTGCWPWCPWRGVSGWRIQTQNPMPALTLPAPPPPGIRRNITFHASPATSGVAVLRAPL